MMSSAPPLACLSLLLLSSSTQAAHSRRRPTTARSSSRTNYDRSVTTFDPSGRLLQVEYAQAAAGRGESLIAAVHDDTVYVVTKSRSKKQQQQLHWIDEELWMVSCGLASDGMFLADILRDTAAEYRPSYGEPIRTEEAAKAAGSFQHRLTLLPGYRPLGVVAVLIGMDDSDPILYRCGPGGVVQNCRFCTAGQHADTLLHALSRREWDASTVVETLVEAMREVCGRKELLDVLVFRSGETIRCYEKIGSDRQSKMNLKALQERN